MEPVRHGVAGSPTDATVWLEALARGEESALAALYDAFAAPVFNLCVRMLRDRGAAEDLLQDVFLEAWRRAERYDAGRGNVLSWLLCMTRSRALDRLRAEKSRQRRERAVGIRMTPAVEPLAHASLQEEGERVRAAFATLPEARRRCLELAYFEGLSQSEIAARLALPLGTVKTHVRKGLQRLRVELGAT